MVDAVNSLLIVDGPRHFEVHRTSLSDGTGETNAIVVDLSTLSADGYGVLPNQLTVDIIQYDVSGFGSITLKYDETTDVPFADLSGSGTFVIPSGRVDTGTGGTGDILISTNTPAAGAMYTINLIGRKKYP